MIDARSCPDRESHKDKACETCGLIMDYPTAFAFIERSSPDDHHEKCSYRIANGGFLCDCDILNNEYERRKRELDGS